MTRPSFWKLFYPSKFIANRYKRFFFHIIYPIYKHPKHLKVSGIKDWFIDFICYSFDILFIDEIYLIINLIFKRSFRKLNEQELQLGQYIFNDHLDYDKIYVDDRASFITKRNHIAYVAFNVVNYWDKMKDYVFIHELMHVYQYTKFGSAYIYRALKAQTQKDCYNYGGAEGLSKAIQSGKNLFDFNFEQQASIIEHFYYLNAKANEPEIKKIIPLYRKFYEDLDLY